MASEADICNMALNRIGASDTIADLNEQSKAAALCRTFYAQSRDTVLRDFPWPFATRFVQLAHVPTQEPQDWLFRYRYPVDCLMARKLSFDGGNNLLWLDHCRFDPEYRARSIYPYRVPYRLAGDDQGQLILCNLDDAWLTYTARIDDVWRYDPLFKSALAWHLATELAMPMTSTVDRANLAEQKYRAEMSKAEAAALNEEQDFEMPESPSIAVRY